MLNLREKLLCLQGRVCYLGLGNVEHGDDGFGVRLAERLVDAGVRDVVIAGSTPEHHIGRLAQEGFDHVVFLDAVEFGGMPGAAIFLQSDEIAARFPQVSTHSISLSLLSKWLEANGRSKVWLLGVQPKSLKYSLQLTPTVQRTLELLSELLRGVPAVSSLEVGV